MAIAEYRLKAVPVFAEQVPEDLAAALEVATRWGAEVLVLPDGSFTLRVRQAVGGSLARPTDWLLDKTGEGKGACTDEEFVASFEQAP